MKSRLSCVVAIIALTMIALAQTAPQTPTSQQAAAQKGIVQGTVMRAGAGQALKRARVTLRRVTTVSALPAGARAGAQGGVATTQAVTDDTGRFVFNGVEPGDYRIAADRDGFLHQEYGQRSTSGQGRVITVSAGQSVNNIEFQLISAGTVSGRIFNEDNEPVAGVQVQALNYVYQQGRRILQPAGQSAQTNDLGEFRLYWLTPGDYYISATARRGLIANVNPVVTQQVAAPRGNPPAGARSAPSPGGRGAQAAPANDETYTPTYFPGAIAPENATPISLPAGAEMRGIDFGIRPVSTVTISGQIIVPVSTGQAAAATPAPSASAGAGAQRGGGGPGGGGRGGPQISVTVTRSGGSRGFGGFGGVDRSNVRPDGSFDVSGVVPGTYNLVAQARQDGQQYSARIKLEVGDGGINNISLPLRAGISIPGKVYVEGTPPAGYKPSQLRVTLTPAEDSAGGPGGGGAAAVGDDSSFTLPNVSPMEYRVRVSGLPQGGYVMAGRIGSMDAVNQSFVLTGEPVIMQLQIGFSSGQVQGTVIDAKGTAYAGAIAALVPDEDHRQRLELFFSGASDQSGHYSFTGVPPGNYKLFAWEDIPSGAYQDPDFIHRYEDRGKPVKVDANGSVAADLPLISSPL